MNRPTIALAVLAAALAAIPAGAPAATPCQQDAARQPDTSCVPLTGGLLMRLRSATRSQVIAALQAPGEAMAHDTLHFRSVAADGDAAPGTGDLMVTFGPAGRVIGIVATIEQGPSAPTAMFSFSALKNRACGDLAGVPSCTAKH